MNIIVTKKENETPKYFVYYHEESGEIFSIGNAALETMAMPFIITGNKLAQKIAFGLESETNCLISSEIDGHDDIVLKSDLLHFFKKEQFLESIPKIEPESWDIKITLFAKNSKWLIEANDDILKKLTSHNSSRIFESNTTLAFYIIKKNQPDMLIDVLEIDAEELINCRQVTFESKNLYFHVTPEDIDILTQKFFRNCWFEISNTALEDENVSKNRFQKVVGIDSNSSDIVMSQIDNMLTISKSDKFDDQKFESQFLKFHVIGQTPDEHFATFNLDINKLKNNEDEIFEIDFNINEVNFIVEHHNANIRKEKFNV